MAKYKFNPLGKYLFDYIGKINCNNGNGGNGGSDGNGGSSGGSSGGGQTAADLYEEYKAKYPGNVMYFQYSQDTQDPSWEYFYDENCKNQTQIGQLETVRCIEIDLYGNAFDVNYDEMDTDDDTIFHRVEILLSDVIPTSDDWKTHFDNIEQNLKQTIYVKIRCAEDIVIPQTEERGYLQISFAIKSLEKEGENGYTTSITWLPYEFPLSAYTGQFKKGDELYSVIWDWKKIRKLKE